MRLRFDGAGMHQAPVTEHDAALRALEDEIEVLFDEEHRQLRAASQVGDHLADALDQVGLHTVGGFVQQEQFRAPAQGA